MTQKNAPERHAWQALMPTYQRQLLEEAWYLVEREKALAVTAQMVDYSFLVFTAAKAYEGFLKTYFFQMGLISRSAYFSPHFRIGKALNPDLPMKYRDEDWLFDDLCAAAGEDLARRLWSTWKLARNQVFHFETGGTNKLSLDEAQERVEAVLETIEAAAQQQGVKKD